MTRLAESDINTINHSLQSYDKLLKNQTGKNLFELSCYATGRTPDISRLKVAAVPVTTGIGVIGGFCDTVAGIVNHLGAKAYVTEKSDVAGMEEAFTKRADILFMADDDTFGAFNLKKGIHSDNGSATGRSFAAALELAAGVCGEPVLVLGAGPVGCAAAQYFLEKKARVFIYDLDIYKAGQMKEAFPEITMLDEWQNRTWTRILDATTAGNFIPSSVVSGDTVIAAPGMPVGVPPETAQKCARVIHNTLELGVAAMLCEVV
ncbi:3-methylornithyl-N6-L-lysine dehydrogenase PylD [Eubacterium limosum]|uniref:3-methylornithyl-N6-L-lysine dehydrogenase PylD n=1 Tax=Eubacterium limosum TaxID=1736 RepID=UPI00106296CF|nr:3-methylornithyl-N6-L-lysine dehydrogenase PylD [Eubacterium limosum]